MSAPTIHRSGNRIPHQNSTVAFAQRGEPEREQRGQVQDDQQDPKQHRFNPF
jgi:hypothetical protein